AEDGIRYRNVTGVQTCALPILGLLITEVAAMKNDTVKKLKSMRLPAFAEAYEKQIDQKAEYGSMSFHERLMLLVDAEYDSRHNKIGRASCRERVEIREGSVEM